MTTSYTQKHKNRLSGIELLRIIAMVMIVAHHFALHTPWGTNAPASTEYIINILASFGKTGVAIFFMITGYFLATQKKYNISKIWNIVCPTWFYSLTIFAIMVVIGLYGAKIAYPLNDGETQSFFPLLSGKYWFIGQYVIVFLLSPFLKKGLDAINEKGLTKLALLLFSINTVIKVLRVILNVGTTSMFVIPEGLYFVVMGYILYKLKPYISNKIACIAASIGTLGLLLWPLIIHPIINIARIKLPSDFFWSSDSILTILLATGAIVIFSNFTFQSKAINYTAGLTLGIYLIHDNIWMRHVLWGSDGLARNLDYINAPWYAFIIHATITILTVYITCSIIEALRQTISKAIKRVIARKPML